MVISSRTYTTVTRWDYMFYCALPDKTLPIKGQECRKGIEGTIEGTCDRCAALCCAALCCAACNATGTDLYRFFSYCNMVFYYALHRFTTSTPPVHHQYTTGTLPVHHQYTTGTPPVHHRYTTGNILIDVQTSDKLLPHT